MIVGCISFYDDDLALLEGALTSLRRYTDKIIAVDGKYSEFPSESLLSNDVVRNFVIERVDELVSVSKVMFEWEKRNLYLRGEEGDWYLVLDGDEELEGELPAITDLNKTDYLLSVYDEDWHIPSYTVRFFKHEKDKRYFRVHSTLWKGDKLIHPDTLDVLDGIRIIHKRNSRNDTRKLCKGEWKKRGWALEQEVREIYKL